MKTLMIGLIGFVLVTSPAMAEYSAAQIKIILSKKAKNAMAQGCGRGQVWCCKRTFSGGTSCECTSYC